MNFYILEYALSSLINQKYKTIFITFILTSLIFLLSSMLFIKSSIKHELDVTLGVLPEITVQNIKAGRHYDIDESLVDEFLEINGVSSASARVWGYYYFENAGVNFSLVGIDEYEHGYKPSMEKASKKLDFNKDVMLVGKGVLDTLKANHYDEYFNFIKPDGTFLKLNIAGVFDADTLLESNDVILMSKDNIKKIFNLDDEMATDIVLRVPNKNEISTIASKIKLDHPSFRVISKEDLSASYQNIFDYKSGIFLALFVVALFSFFIIIYGRASGLSSEQKREIGILRSIGWRVDDILKERFYEGFIISFFAYIVGIAISLFYVYIAQAPLLRGLFSGYSKLKPEFELMFVLDYEALALLFFLSIPIYIAAIIIPSWKSATSEVDEVLR